MIFWVLKSILEVRERLDFLNGKLSLDEFLDIVDELDKEGLEEQEMGEKSIEDSEQNPPNAGEKDPEMSSVYFAVRGLRKTNEYQL